VGPNVFLLGLPGYYIAMYDASIYLCLFATLGERHLVRVVSSSEP
jgi:hypothetical protein